MADDEIVIGVVATLVGPLAGMGEDALRGVELAINEFGGQVAGKYIVLLTESSSAIPDVAVHAAERLLDKERVDFVIGPLSGNEGLAMREFAKTRPDKVFINGISAAQDTTLRDPAPNFYTFSPDGVQWIAGLGRYAYEVLGCRRVVTLAEDYSYPHAQVGSFVLEFCRAGGDIIDRQWVALGTRDYSAVIESVPADADAVFVALVGTDSLNFLQQYLEAGRPFPLIGGTNTLDQFILKSIDVPLEQLVGITCGAPIADDNPHPAWQQFYNAYRNSFHDGLNGPSHLAYGYYNNTKAALLALAQVDGDVSGDQSRFKQALAALEFDCPTGPVRLDHNRCAIATNFVTEVTLADDGMLYHRLMAEIPEVNQTLGMPEDEFLRIGRFNRDVPACG